MFCVGSFPCADLLILKIVADFDAFFGLQPCPGILDCMCRERFPTLLEHTGQMRLLVPEVLAADSGVGG